MRTKLPLLALLLIGSLLLAAASHASAAVPTTVPFAFEEEPEEGGEFEEEEPDEEFGENECEIAEGELEEGLLTVADVEELCALEDEIRAEEEAEEAGAASATGRCAVRSARAHATTVRNRLKLTIGYTTNEPTKARIEIHAGKHKLGSIKRHLGRSGVIRIGKRLGEKTRNKQVKLQIKLPQGGAGCPSRRLVLLPK